MVFCIKYRKKILFKKDRVEFFKEICFEIGERYWFEFDAIGTDGDHVHIFVGAAPRYAPSRIICFNLSAPGALQVDPAEGRIFCIHFKKYGQMQD